MISLTQRRVCIVRRRNGIDSIRYSNGMLVPFSMLRTPEQLEDRAAIFLRAYRPKPGDVVVDAGAGIGEEIPLFAGLVGKRGRVVAIEAHPAVFARLSALGRLYGLEHVTCLHAAIVDAPGTAYITNLENPLSNSVVTDNGTIPVPAETLDDLLGRLEVGRVDFLKMNIEGAELRALEGFTNGLPRTRHLAVACHDRRAEDGESDTFRTRDGVTSLLESKGFELLDVPRGRDPWEQDWVYARVPSSDE